MARIWVGSSDEPTEEKPVVQNTIRSAGQETSVKKVLVTDHDEKVDRLRAESIKIRAQMGELLEKVRTMNEPGGSEG